MKFLSPQEIVEDIIKNDRLGGNLSSFVQLPYKDLIMMHHGLGQWIRNSYGLWNKENPYTMKDYVPQIEKQTSADVNGKTVMIEGAAEVDVSHRHPDFVSQRIIEELWKHYNLPT